MLLGYVSDCHPLDKDYVINVDTYDLLSTKTHNTPQTSPHPLLPR